jgi:hypothetical protein
LKFGINFLILKIENSDSELLENNKSRY